MASNSLSENHSPIIVINSTLLTIFLLLISSTHSSTTLIEELNTLRPPPDFNTTLTKNCQHNPSLRYCNKFSSPSDLNEIFKFTIVASHLCNESKNPNCVESFPKIDLKNRPRFAPLYLSFDFFWKYCPLDIVSVDFSNNSLKGKFPNDVLLCTQIKLLDLSFNQLSGEIPVESFYSLTNLTGLNLSYNHFSEIKITDINFFAGFNSSSFIRSGLFPSHHHYTIKAIILLACFPIFIIMMICLLGWLCFHRPDYLPKMFRKRYKFTVPILKAATNNFSKKNLLSKQDGVAIYKGILRDNTKVKIEIYRGNTVISREDQRNFKQECKVLVNLRHKNLVRVLGWCSNRRLRSVVAEWMNHAENIESWLSGLEPSPWKNRLKVMIGVVEGMRYLQEEWPEVGYDLNTSSILLSDNLEPLISRFKVDNRNNYTKSKYKDIYKFGVFLLEMIVNRRPWEDFGGEAGFVGYVRTHYPDNLQKVIDERMQLKEHMIDQAKQGIGLGLMCTDQASGKFPSLHHISSMIARVYRTCLNSESDESYRRSHSDGVSTQHKHVKFR